MYSKLQSTTDLSSYLLCITKPYIDIADSHSSGYKAEGSMTNSLFSMYDVYLISVDVKKNEKPK